MCKVPQETPPGGGRKREAEETDETEEKYQNKGAPTEENNEKIHRGKCYPREKVP